MLETGKGLPKLLIKKVMNMLLTSLNGMALAKLKLHALEPLIRLTERFLELAIRLYEESQGVTKRCHLSLLTNSALVYEPK